MSRDFSWLFKNITGFGVTLRNRICYLKGLGLLRIEFVIKKCHGIGLGLCESNLLFKNVTGLVCDFANRNSYLKMSQDWSVILRIEFTI